MIQIREEVYRRLKSRKGSRSFSEAIAGMLDEAGEMDVEEYLAELMKKPPEVDTALLRRRQKNPPRSNRSARAARHAV